MGFLFSAVLGRVCDGEWLLGQSQFSRVLETIGFHCEITTLIGYVSEWFVLGHGFYDVIQPHTLAWSSYGCSIEFSKFIM